MGLLTHATITLPHPYVCPLSELGHGTPGDIGVLLGPSLVECELLLPCRSVQSTLHTCHAVRQQGAFNF